MLRMNMKPRLRLSIRAFFVIVTICGYIAYGFAWKHQRQLFVEQPTVFVLESLDFWEEQNSDPLEIPLLLRLIDAPVYLNIQYSIDANDRFRLRDLVMPEDETKVLTDGERRELARVRRLFPEAGVNVRLGPFPKWPP